MGELVFIVFTLMLAALFFEIAWRVVAAVILLAPGAWIGLVAASFAADNGASFWLAAGAGTAAFLLASRATFLLIGLVMAALSNLRERMI